MGVFEVPERFRVGNRNRESVRFFGNLERRVCERIARQGLVDEALSGRRMKEYGES